MKKNSSGMKKETDIQVVYKNIVNCKDHISKDIFRQNPFSRETTVKIEDTTYIIYKIKDWTDDPLIFVSDEKLSLLDDSILFEIWKHIKDTNQGI